MGAPADTGHDLWPRRIEDLRDHDAQPEILELVVEQSDPAPARFGWGALIALVAAVAIDAALVWLVRDALAAPAPLQIVQIATALCVVPALVGILWLLAQRTSRAEARRFGQTSRAMRAEAAALEERIAILSHQIDLQRSHLNDQLAALAQTGDVAAIRLESIGRAMAAEIDRADVHAHRLTEAAQHAHELVGELLVAIPSARADAEEIGRRIDQAGLAAAAQIAGLDAQLHALTDRAHEADVVATTAAERLAGNLARMSETGDAARLRLESLSAELATTVDALVGRTERAVDQARAGLAAEGEALVVALATHQTRLDGQARDTAVALQRQIDAVGEAAEGARATLAMHGEAMVATLKSHQADLDASARGGADALERHAATVADRMRAAQTLFEDRAAALLATVQDHQATVDAGAQAGVAQLEAQAAAVAARLDAAHHALADQGTVLLATLDRHQQALGKTAREGAESLERQADAVDARLRDAHAALGTQGEAMLGTLRAHQAALDASARDGVTLLARQVEAVDGRMDAARTALTERATAMLDSIGRHHDALDTASRDGTAALEAQIAAVDAAMARARADLAAQGEAMLTLLDARRIALDQAAQDGTEALAERLDTVDRAVDHIAQRFAAQAGTADAMVAGLHDAVAGVERRLDALQEQGVDRSQWLAASISALGGSADAMTEALKSGEAMATRTIGTTERLLTALDAAAREIDETLPDALARLDARIGDSRSVVAQAKPELLALVTAAGSTHDAIAAIADVIADQRRALDQLGSGLSATLATGRDQAEALGDSVEATIDRAHRFAEDAAPRLLVALERVRDTAQDAADSARDTLSQVIPQAAASLESASAEAMRRATTDTVLRQVDAIADATRAAVDAATGATERLAAQVRTIAEQSALVETTIADARSEREAAENDTLARRVSLLIEALNSASIDITHAFAPEVSDSAWAAYLKGDRGVFTRRAVRLLDATQSREVADLYDADAGFRDQVNRYIHDFEAMLRAILAQRDGSPLGVTLLSSDMGKLYVALAQAIERLR